MTHQILVKALLFTSFPRAVIALLSATLVMVLNPGNSTAQAQSLPETIYVASGQSGSLQHTVASAVAKVLSQELNTSVVVRPYSGTTAFFPLLNKGEVGFAIAPSVDFGLSYEGPENLKIGGRNPYPATPNLRLVASGSNLIAGMLVRDESKIKTVKDLKGHILAGGYPAHLGAYVNTYAHLINANLTWDDVESVPVAGLNQGLDALTSNRVEGAAYGVGAPGVQEADVATGVRFIPDDCSEKAKARVTDAIPGYKFITLKSGSITGIIKDTCITAYPLYLVTNSRMSDDVVAAVTKALYANADKLAKFHPTLKSWTSSTMVNANMSLPYHNAAIDVYKTEGEWSEDAAITQKKLLVD